jgi:predicted Zn finger-like uncharacterized protein
MIVTCPECSTRYLVDPRALGVSGRLVRCAHCSHTWHQAPPEDAPRRIEMPATGIDPMLGGEERFQLPAVTRPRRSSWAIVGWLVLALILAGIGVGSVWARDQVVGWWPPAARLYALVGLPVVQPGTGLELRKVTPTREVENGLPTLVIEGEVANVSNVARPVPKLKVILRDSNDHELQAWTFAVTDERLLPGASVPFRTSVTQPSEAATGVVVTFAGTSG